MLFSHQRVHKISIPAKDSKNGTPNIKWLIDHLCANLMKDPRKDLFVLDDTVYLFHTFTRKTTILIRCRRPGILVLVNESDWSLEGEESYEIQAKDHIMFISTLHGG